MNEKAKILKSRCYFGLLLVLLSNSAIFSETFDGIDFGWKISDIKRAYSGAKLEKIDNAKIRSNRVEFRITGARIEGSIDLMLSDTSITFCAMRMKEKFPEKSIDGVIEDCEKMGIRNYSDSLATIERITWNPSKKINANKYLKKYGEPDTVYINDKLEAVSVWNSRNVFVVYDEDENDVIRIEFYPSYYDIFRCAEVDVYSNPSCVLWRSRIAARTKSERSQLLINFIRTK